MSASRTGMSPSIATRARISAATTGRIVSAQTRARQSASTRGRPGIPGSGTPGRPVICPSTGQTWPSVSAAARGVGVTRSVMRYSVSHGGTWRYA
jgi:hypothetical protein